MAKPKNYKNRDIFLQLVNEGKTVEEIADYFGYTVHTVKDYYRLYGLREAKKHDDIVPTINQVLKAYEEHTCSHPVAYTYKGKKYADITQDFTDRGSEYENK